MKASETQNVYLELMLKSTGKYIENSILNLLKIKNYLKIKILESFWKKNE